MVLDKRNPASCVVSAICLFCHITIESLKRREIGISKPQSRMWPLVWDTHPFFFSPCLFSALQLSLKFCQSSSWRSNLSFSLKHFSLVSSFFLNHIVHSAPSFILDGVPFKLVAITICGFRLFFPRFILNSTMDSLNLIL